MTNIFNIQNDTVFIDKLVPLSLQGPITLPDKLEMSGSVHVTDSISTKLLEVNTLCVGKIINMTDDATSTSNTSWVVESEQELVNQGLTWKYKGGTIVFQYKLGNTISTNANIELSAESALKINNVIVLNSNTLGSTVVKSNLRQVGPLNSLDVMGDATFGEFVSISSTHNRMGVGTDSPNYALSVIENNVELAIGSQTPGKGTIGTFSNHSLDMVTDNVVRVTVTNDGEVQIGNPSTKNGVLRVFGPIYSDSIISDTRLTRSSSLEFINDVHDPIYNKGIVWKGDDKTKYFLLNQSPLCFRMSETLNLSFDKTYNINDDMVLSRTHLGDTVQYSNLSQVGELTDLTVLGAIKSNRIEATALDVTASSFNILINDAPAVAIDGNQLVIGSAQSLPIQAKLFGNLSIGINNPDPMVSLAVRGNISFSDKKFITGNSIPTDGTFVKGDICWNQEPEEYGVVGWVCILSGTPGEWRSFGGINSE